MKFFLHEASPRWRCAAPCAAESGEAGASGRVDARAQGAPATTPRNLRPKPYLTKGTVFRKSLLMKWILSRHIPEAVRVAVSIFGIYLFAYFLVWAIVSPVQHTILPGLTPLASLLFLPHGVRVLATALLGRHALPGLVSAELAGNYVFWGLSDPVMLFLLSATSGSVTWVAFEGLRRLGIDAFYPSAYARPPPFNALLLAAIAAAVINAFAITAILEGPGVEQQVTLMLAAIVTGDVTGFLMTMMIARWALPLLTRKPD
jgi:hypothetical protein